MSWKDFAKAINGSARSASRTIKKDIPVKIARKSRRYEKSSENTNSTHANVRGKRAIKEAMDVERARTSAYDIWMGAGKVKGKAKKAAG